MVADSTLLAMAREGSLPTGNVLLKFNKVVSERCLLTAKVRAMSAVAHHLGTDLTTERGKRDNGEHFTKFTWWCFEGGSHVVRAGVGLEARFFSVDLVLGEVALRVGLMPRRANR